MSEDYTLKAEDAGKTLEVNDENPNNTVKIIVPEHSNSPIPIGTEIKVYRGNEAQAEFEPQNNVEIVSARKEIFAPTFFIRKYGEAQIRKRALNQWVLKGDLLYFNIFAEGGDEIFTIEQNGQLYRVHTFTTVGSNEFDVITRNNEPSEVEYLIVAGGGSGGNGRGGGGGGGGLLTGFTSVALQSYTINVGAGGTQSTTQGQSETFTTEQGNSGQNSTAFGLTAIGGGGGGTTSENALSGGSGGGAGNSGSNPGTGTAGQGNNGGLAGGPANWVSVGIGSGGGGAGQAGFTGGSSPWGKGGDGLLVNITGTPTYYAGGGGGSNSEAVQEAEYTNRNAGLGGLGGGGRGQNRSLIASRPGLDGTPNTGGGGGGTDRRFQPATFGGSGIVIVRYPIRQAED